MFAGITFQDLFAVLDATLRVSTPLILCAMAGLFSERSGIIDISLEGKLLATAFAAASVSTWTGSPWLALNRRDGCRDLVVTGTRLCLYYPSRKSSGKWSGRSIFLPLA